MPRIQDGRKTHLGNYGERRNYEESKLLQPSWPCYTITDHSADEYVDYDANMDLQMGDCEFSPSVATTEDSFNISYIPYFSIDDILNLPVYGDVMQVMSPLGNSLNLEEFGYTSNDNLSSSETDDASQWMGSAESMFTSEDCPNQEIGASLSSSTNMRAVESLPIVQTSLLLPTEGVDIDNQTIIPHLLKAYGDAMGNEEQELAEVIMKRVREKVSSSGASVERLGYHLFESLDNQGDYLRQESCKNYEAAFKAFYQIFPYGRFAHFTANLAILEAMPKDTKTVHIIDFDLGDGLQWPPLIEAIGQHKSIRLTSVKRKEDNCDQSLSQWRFEDTRRQLDHHAKSLGLKLEVDEMNMEEISNLKKLGSEWLAINCMLGLPHMGRSSSRRNAMEFIMVAEELITKSSKRGIVVLGDGNALNQSVGNCSSFGSFFDEHLVHYNAMLESIDWHFPAQLPEAKIAMECLFLAPNVSSDACFQSWKDGKEQCGVKSRFGLEGWRFSIENMMHTKEMVKDGEGLYGVKLQGENENEMVLEWRGASLVKVSTWR